MSRHFDILERTARERGFASKPGTPKVHADPRGPILPISHRSRVEIEKAVNRLFRRTASVTPRVVVFTAFEPGSGSTWVCAHVGDLLSAVSDASVCLVDGNLRTPALHKELGILGNEGLTDLVGEPDVDIKNVIVKVSGTELCLLTCGSLLTQRSECIIHSDRMRDRIAELRTSFDFVLIDAPAVSVSSDALSLAQLADGLVLVVRAGLTRKSEARRLTEDLTSSGVKLLGAILNDYASPLPEALARWL